MPAEPDQLREFAQRYTAAWCSHDPRNVAAHYAPEGSLTINENPPSVGRAGIHEAAESFFTAIPDLHLVMDELRVLSDGVEYHWTFTGSHTGPGGTGNRVRISGFEEWTIDDDGLIAESLGHFDEAEYARQIEHGLAKPE
jgi:uncharacterized protein (TIGR02246 family)